MMSQRCRNDVVMGVLPGKGKNGTLWNVMGPVRNGDGKGNGRSRNGYTERIGVSDRLLRMEEVLESSTRREEGERREVEWRVWCVRLD